MPGLFKPLPLRAADKHRSALLYAGSTNRGSPRTLLNPTVSLSIYRGINVGGVLQRRSFCALGSVG